MTKKEAATRKANWTRAVDEGRVVNYGGASMQEFKTVAEAQAAVADADCAEVFIVVRPS